MWYTAAQDRARDWVRVLGQGHGNTSKFVLGLLLTGVDAALYMESEHFAAIVHRFPWDVVYQAGRSARGQDECFGLRRGHWPVRQVNRRCVTSNTF